MMYILGAEQTVIVGKPADFDSNSPNGKYAIYFKDDGRVGWCYAFDRQIAEDEVQCALHVYNADDFPNRGTPLKIQIVWTADETKAAVLLDGVPNAIFDFTAKRGRSRSGLGLTHRGWENNHDWDVDLVHLFA